MNATKLIFSKLFFIFACALVFALPTTQTYPMKAKKQNQEPIIIEINDFEIDTKSQKPNAKHLVLKAMASTIENLITIWIPGEKKYEPIQIISPLKNNRGKTIVGHDKRIVDISYDPFSKMLVSIDPTGLIIVWARKDLVDEVRFYQAQRIKKKLRPENIAWALPGENMQPEYSFDILSHYEPRKTTFRFNKHTGTFLPFQDLFSDNFKNIQNKPTQKKAQFRKKEDLFTKISEDSFATTCDASIIIWTVITSNGERKRAPLQILKQTNDNSSKKITGHAQDITHLDYNQKYKILASADKAGTLILWSLNEKTGQFDLTQIIKTDISSKSAFIWNSTQKAFAIFNGATTTLFIFDKDTHEFKELFKRKNRPARPLHF